jgi:hypothetical protein
MMPSLSRIAYVTTAGDPLHFEANGGGFATNRRNQHLQSSGTIIVQVF